MDRVPGPPITRRWCRSSRRCSTRKWHRAHQTIGHAGTARGRAAFAGWFARLPPELTADIKLQIPGVPGSGGTDNAAFNLLRGAGIQPRSLPWEYFTYTWHTNRDTFDKIRVRGSEARTRRSSAMLTIPGIGGPGLHVA